MASKHRPSISRTFVLLLFIFGGVGSYASSGSALVPEGFETWTLVEQKKAIRDSSLAHGPETQRTVAFCHLLIELGEKDGDLENLAHASEKLAYAYTERGLTVLGQKYSMMAYEVAKQISSEKVLWALFRLTSIEASMDNYEKALDYGNEALDLAQSMAANEFENNPKEVLISFCYNSLGEVHREFGFPGKAIESYQAAIEILGTDDDPSDLRLKSALGHNLGLTYVDLGDLETGEKYLKEFNPESTGEWNEIRFFEWQQAYIKLHRKDGKPSKALELLIEGKQKAKDLGYPLWEKDFMEVEIDVRTDLEDSAQALELMKRVRELEKELSGEAVQKQIAVLGFQLELSKEMDERLILESQADNQKWMVGILLAVSLLIVLLAFFQYRSILKARGTNKLLAKKNDRLDQLLNEKEMWMNLMAHDLKAPLHLIGGLTEMVGSMGVMPEVRGKAIANIRKSALQGTELISQLLELANAESGNLAIDFKQIDLNELVRELHQGLLASAASKGIELGLELDEQVAPIKSDPVLIHRIMGNLCSNALKFSPSNSKVVLGTLHDQGQPGIFVRDAGPGISPEEQRQLFQKFVRLSPQPTAGESSTGLGLAIVGVLAEKLGACIDVQSELGKGSTFSLIFNKA